MQLPLWVRSVLRRPAPAVGVVLVVALTMVTAISGPLLLRAVQASALQQDVAAAGTDTSIAVAARSGGAQGRADVLSALTAIAGSGSSRR